MKIGILTLPIYDNYGGILQALALYRFLYAKGYDVTLIYKEGHQSFLKKAVKAMLVKIPFHNFKNIKTYNKELQKRNKRKILHADFINNEIYKISESLYTKKDLEEYTKKKKFDAVIVGSDQVWRKEYIDDSYYKSYFLDFINSEKIKKIAYAASFGKSYWEGKDDHDDISQLLSKFTAISTRESSGIDICRDNFKIDNVKHVLDPTILMNKEFYLELISKYTMSSNVKGGFITYVLDEDEEKRKIIKLVKDNLNIKHIHNLKGFSHSDVTYSIPEWLCSLHNADFILTDSFHGMVFSIIFNKDFIVIGNKDRGLDRFKSLLSLLKLEERLILNEEELKNKKLDKINYEKVNKLLNTNKKLSINFMMDNLYKDS